MKVQTAALSVASNTILILLKVIAGALTVWAAAADHAGGIWGASRHAVTVGFLAAMVFAIGQKILPAFCAARILFNRHAMLASLLLLNVGCALRVASASISNSITGPTSRTRFFARASPIIAAPGTFSTPS